MANPTKQFFCQLDLSNQEQLIAYERAFYSSFIKVRSNQLVRQLWLWDMSEQRLATRIPYSDQIIYTLQTEPGKIDTGFAVNTTLKAFQSSAFGFYPPPNAAGCCEILAFFSVAYQKPMVKIKFWQQCRQELVRLGFHTVYATCAAHPLKSFCRFGGIVLAEAEIQNEQRFFLKFCLEDTLTPEIAEQSNMAQI